MKTINSSDTKEEDRTRLRSLFALLLILLSLIPFPNLTSQQSLNVSLRNQKIYLLSLFAAGYATKKALLQTIDIFKDNEALQDDLNKNPDSLVYNLISWQKSLGIDIAKDLALITSTLFLKNMLKAQGFDALAARAMTNAFDAGIKTWSISKFMRKELVPFITERILAIENSPYRYTLNSPLASHKNTITLGCQDVKSSHVISRVVSSQDTKAHIASTGLFAALGYALADWSHDTAAQLASVTSFGSGFLAYAGLSKNKIAHKLLSKTIECVAETELFDILSKSLAFVLSKISGENLETFTDKLESGLHAVVTHKGSGPTQVKFLQELGVLA